MNNITLTIELCQEDRARLDNILTALQKSPLERAGEAVGKMGEAVKAMAEKVSAPAPEAPAPAEEQQAEPEPKKQEAPAPAPAAPEVTTEPEEPEETVPEVDTEPEEPEETVPEVDTATLQSKVVQLVNSGKRDEAKAIILEYASCVSQVPAEKRAEVLARLNKLEG